MVRLLGVFVAFLCLFSSNSVAYGPTGHRTIAELASRHLTPEAAAAIKELLGNEFMAEAATWPDEMRSNPDKYWQQTSQTYHYINLPDGVSYENSEKNPAGDAYTALAMFREQLRDKSVSLEERRKALSFIIHIIGDLHMPLHAGRREDWGGNRIEVVWFGRMTNLHMVWDEDFINQYKLSFTEWTRFLDAKISPEQIMEWQHSEPLDWVNEIVALRGDIYDVGSAIFSYEYIYRHAPTLKSQLSKGGIRLAGYLNQLFKAE